MNNAVKCFAEIYHHSNNCMGYSQVLVEEDIVDKIYQVVRYGCTLPDTILSPVHLTTDILQQPDDDKLFKLFA